MESETRTPHSKPNLRRRQRHRLMKMPKCNALLVAIWMAFFLTALYRRHCARLAPGPRLIRHILQRALDGVLHKVFERVLEHSVEDSMEYSTECLLAVIVTIVSVDVDSIVAAAGWPDGQLAG